jgi:hypothetical protein
MSCMGHNANGQPPEETPRLTKAYIAGFFDGEGSIGARVDKRGNPRLYISIGQKNPSFLGLLHDHFGYGFSSGYYWRAYRRDDVKDFIRYVYPYSLIKKPQLRLAWIFLHTRDYDRRCQLVERICQLKKEHHAQTF